MKKPFLLLIFLIFTSSNAFFIENTFLQAIENYKNAYNNLEKNIDQIKVSRFYYGGIRELRYICKTTESYDSLKAYKNAKESFQGASFINALGDGFILGILAAYCNRTLNGKILNKKIILSTVACIIGLAYYKNYKIDKTPYFDEDLKKQPNNEILSLNLLLPFISAFIGYLGMEFTLIKISEIFKIQPCPN